MDSLILALAHHAREDTAEQRRRVRAVGLLLDGKIHPVLRVPSLVVVRATAAGSTNPNRRYTLERAGEAWGCDCPDHRQGWYCKHSRAMHLLDEAIRRAVAARQAGTLHDYERRLLDVLAGESPAFVSDTCLILWRVAQWVGAVAPAHFSPLLTVQERGITYQIAIHPDEAPRDAARSLVNRGMAQAGDTISADTGRAVVRYTVTASDQLREAARYTYKTGVQ